MLYINFTIAINTNSGNLEEIQITAPILGISSPLGKRIYSLPPIVFYAKPKQRFVARYIYLEADTAILSYFLESATDTKERSASVYKYEITDQHPSILRSELVYPKEQR